MEIITTHLEKIFNDYTRGPYYEDMKVAIEIYQNKTGRMDEDSPEYESRMHSFNDWFIFSYRKNNGERMIDKYIRENGLEYELGKAFSKANYSVFHFKKINFRKRVVIQDILQDEKFTLAKDCGDLPLVEDDLFVGRSVKYKEQYYLLHGICMLPRNTLSILKKECKRMRVVDDRKKQDEFLLKVEALKNKSLQYGHIDSSKLFIFENLEA